MSDDYSKWHASRQIYSGTCFKNPDWLNFFLSKNSPGKVALSLKGHLISFNDKDFIKKCSGCKKDAMYATLYQGNAKSPMYWCNDCDPYSSGANKGILTAIKTYDQALRFVNLSCRESRTGKRILIKELAQAKGLPTRISQKIAIEFLS